MKTTPKPNATKNKSGDWDPPPSLSFGGGSLVGAGHATPVVHNVFVFVSVGEAAVREERLALVAIAEAVTEAVAEAVADATADADVSIEVPLSATCLATARAPSSMAGLT